MKNIFTLEDIEKAISQSPKHTIDIETPPNIDGKIEREIEAVEMDMFLFRLFGSNRNEYFKYKKSKQS